MQILASPRVTPLKYTSSREVNDSRSYPIPSSRETGFSQPPQSPSPKNDDGMHLDRRLENLDSLMNATMGRLESLERLIHQIQIDQQVYSMNFRTELEEQEKNRYRALFVSFHGVLLLSQRFTIFLLLVDHGNYHTNSYIHLLECTS